MTTLTTIPYPMVDGSRASFVSLEAKFNGVIYFITSITYNRNREIEVLYANNRDPIGQTAGQNSYETEWEMYLAEFNAMQKALGAGYGDIYFPIDCTYSQDGLDLVHDQIVGARLLKTDAPNKKGPEGLIRTCSSKPMKILFGGIDDNPNPLGGAGA